MTRYNCDRSGCVDVFRASIVETAEYAGDLEIPALHPVDMLPDEMTPFSQAISSGRRRGWVHFFEDDVKFERVWNSPGRYLRILEQFDGVIAPDFSVYRDMPLVMQQRNIYRSRAVAHALQDRGQKSLPICALAMKEPLEPRAWEFRATQSLQLGLMASWATRAIASCLRKALAMPWLL